MKSHYSSVKARTDSGLKSSKSKLKYQFQTGNLWRSYSAIDLCTSDVKSSGNIKRFPLRRVQSFSKLEVKDPKPPNFEQVVVNYAFFERYRKKSLKLRYNHNRKQPDPSSNEPQRSPKPILRKSKFFAEDEKGLEEVNDILTSPLQQQQQQQQPIKAQNQKSKEQKKKPEVENTSPSKETTINGIPLSKIQRQKLRQPKSTKKPNSLKLKQTSPKDTSSSSSPKKATIKSNESPSKKNTKTPEELEKDGARNFARCLLGILPNVLKATEPSAADELLQQFASDVCEAVTCMTLKRKNVPNFGTIRTLEIKKEDTVDKDEVGQDPSLNAECVYKAVYEALKLSYELNQLGFYDKAGATPHVSQVTRLSF